MSSFFQDFKVLISSINKRKPHTLTQTHTHTHTHTQQFDISQGSYFVCLSKCFQFYFHIPRNSEFRIKTVPLPLSPYGFVISCLFELEKCFDFFTGERYTYCSFSFSLDAILHCVSSRQSHNLGF